MAGIEAAKLPVCVTFGLPPATRFAGADAVAVNPPLPNR